MRKAILTLLLLFAFVATPAGASELPPTIPHPPCGSEICFSFSVVEVGEGPMWTAPYLYETPYTEDAGWLPGDRIGYGCWYAFMQAGGEIIGRATVNVIPGAESYILVNDKFMPEAQRYYDGSINPTGHQAPSGECPAVEEGLYEPGHFDDRPVVAFWQDEVVQEIRDYRTTVVSEGTTFRLAALITEPFQITTTVSGTHTVNNRVSVIAYLDDVPVATIYYDSLNGGSMFEPEAVNSTDCNAVVSMSQGRQVYNGSRKAIVDPSPLEALTGEQWMGLFAGGQTLPYFTQASNWNTFEEQNRCGTDAEIDRIVFLFDPRQSASDTGSNMIANLNAVAGIVANKYPNAEFSTVLLVGANGHVVCTIDGQAIAASQTHADRIVAAQGYPNAGPDLDVPCSSYADKRGHLTNAGAVDAMEQLAAFYSGG